MAPLEPSPEVALVEDISGPGSTKETNHIKVLYTDHADVVQTRECSTVRWTFHLDPVRAPAGISIEAGGFRGLGGGSTWHAGTGHDRRGAERGQAARLPAARGALEQVAQLAHHRPRPRLQRQRRSG